MSQSVSSQSMLDRYWGEWTERFSFTPWIVHEKPDSHIEDYFKPRSSMEVDIISPLMQEKPDTHATNEASDEVSLLHGLDDLDDLLDADEPPPRRDVPSENLKYAFKRIMHDQEQEIEKKKRLIELVDEVNNNEPRKKRKLKRFSEKQHEEKEEENKSDDLDLSLSDKGDAMEVDDAVEEERKDEAAARLAKDLFAEDEFLNDANLTEPKTKRMTLSTSADGQSLVNIENIEPDILAKKKLKIVMENSIPLEFGHYDMSEVRCVYAANPLTEGWSPLELEALVQGEENFDILSEIRYDEHAITSSMWGVFTVHKGDTDSQKRRKNRNQLDALDSDAIETMGDTHWFILIGPDAVMKLIVSPFFVSTVRVVRVERRGIKFGWSKQVPIFYAYNVVSKIPLWPLTENWKPGQLMRLLCDTLYAHVEYKCRKSGEDVRDCVGKVLSNIEAFPMALSKPWESCLAPANVPLNNYSTRKDRTERLKDFIVKPYKVQNATYSTSTIQETKPLLGCLTHLVTPADFLLTDLEKPSDIWETIVDKFAVPVEVVSAVTNWQRDRQDAVASKLKVFTRLAEMNQLNKESPILDRDLHQIALNIHFAPEWFDGWFSFARDKNNKEERLRLYAFFAAVSLWNQTLREAERFGSVSTFILTKARQTYLFDQGYLWTDEAHLASIRLADEKDTRNHDVALLPEEKTLIMIAIVDHFKIFNKSTKPAPFEIHADRYGSITSTAAIHAERYKISMHFARFILQICALNANVREQIQPDALASIPPLFVQSSSIYGKTTDNDPKAFHAQLITLCEKKAEVLIVPSKRSVADLAALLNKPGVVHVLVFDDFHNWSISQLGYVISTLEQSGRLTKCTHLIVLGYTHTLGYINGGSSLLWELLEVAEHLEGLMGFKTGNEGSQVSGLMQSLQATRFQPVNPSVGLARGDIFYTYDDRREQIKANEKVLLFEESKDVNSVCRYLLNRIEKLGRVRTAFVAARYKTLNHVKRLLTSQNYTLLNVKPSLFEFYTFHTIENDPLILQDFDYIVFGDLDYTGAGRVNFMHFNTAFEHARRGVLFISELAVVDKYDVSAHFEQLFLSNDIKSERHLLHLARCPVLRNHFFDKYFGSEKVKAMLKCSTVTRASKDSHND